MDKEFTPMRILLIGAGVIGTVYGAQLADAGHIIDVYNHGSRTEQIKKTGLIIRDVTTGTRLCQPVSIVSSPETATYSLVLVAIRRDQLDSVLPIIKQLRGEPTILLFGNNPNGHSVLSENLPNTVELGFPGIGGSMQDGSVEYIRIAQQPTSIQANASSPTLAFAEALRLKGFRVNMIADMEGYLLYHAVFVASIAAALYRCNTNPAQLANDHNTLRLMCRAIEEGFRALRSKGHGGEPRNLHVLHSTWLRPFAVWYWGRTFSSPLGELVFAAHARHARGEMDELAHAIIVATADGPTPSSHLQQLLHPSIASAQV